jgi:alpha-D-xyloside xylohydrolase
MLPMGPELQYTDEKPSDPITLWVYEGASASSTLYEDESVNYNYEQGASATISLTWDEENRTLTIGERDGSFPGMLAARTFRIVFVSKDKPLGHTAEPEPARIVSYSGREVVVDAR